jgi:serine/arginine repetitive matrix protein 2
VDNILTDISKIVDVSFTAPEPLKLASEARARFNSLDSGILLNSPPIIGPSQESVRSEQTLQFSEPKSNKVSDPPATRPRSATPTIGGLLAPPSNGLLAPPSNANQGSIALRAIRSVRSLARIGNWNDKEAASVKKEKKDKTSKEGTIKEGKKKKEKKTKEEDVEGGEKKKKKKDKKDKTNTIRQSTSSFEAGALTASPEVSKTLGRKKHSIMGLGLPSTMRLPTVRNGSTASSIPPVTTSGNRLSVESAVKVMGRDRAGSTMSTASSLRPVSVASSLSRASSGSSCASVKWDEEGLETVREQRMRERASKNRTSTDSEDMKSKAKTESRHSLEGRRRTPLSEVFPDIQQSDSPIVSVRRAFPILTIEEATSDGHEAPDDEELLEEERETGIPAVAATPVKKARARPVSEQLLGRSRPKPMHEDEDGKSSVLSDSTLNNQEFRQVFSPSLMLPPTSWPSSLITSTWKLLPVLLT